ncbi:penicillin amidase [Actinacidiphila yanglinensis]|uniref:Penicillin amidase n=1 Tax=Actinacidiphila yanglinensis TaxID=310779 RepID=A0A1H6DGB0_9ACTN|nr:penicillin acylase family protein [Actinacidiphila yanglinensis]SEG84398.1 penicillin amidase [Actinacidiphila yanglinensis]
MAARLRRVAACLTATLSATLLMFVLGVGIGPVPALGRALAPGGGVWPSAAGARLPHSQALRIPGLTGTAEVSFTSSGMASVQASNDHDLFLAQGYVTARNRLTQMDLERRLGEGRLAQLQGSSAVASDTFELRLGLERTARAEWAATAPGSPAGQALTAYAQGVNDRLAELHSTHEWPAIYGLTGVHPARWTPVDSMVVQEVLTQQLDFTTAPLDYSILQKSLGAADTARWFPVQPANAQQPYDPGPYHYLGTDPLAAANANAAAVPATSSAAPTTAAATTSTTTADAAAAAVSILSGTASLPDDLRHIHPDSNAWAVNGSALRGGVSLLAGDPHLQLSLPSYWYEVSLRSPGFDVTGASLPGMPAILLGHNAHISWSLTDVQNQSTLFYKERTSSSHPDEYFWRGAWRPLQKVHYTIPVRGASSVPLTVNLTVHGPIMTEKGQTTSVDWMGDIPSADLSALLSVNTASDWGGFTKALREWRAPTQNFVYADDQGHIGIIAPGYYPLVRSGKPWLPLSGTGESDISGTIPFAAVPKTYDPPGHVVATANQRPVGANYPYYIGTSQGFDPGYRADEIYGSLDGTTQDGSSGSAALQSSVTDSLARSIVPRLLSALDGTSLDARSRSVRTMLAGWNGSMDASSPAASVWWTFWGTYLSTVFQPWWDEAKVPVSLDPWNLDLGHAPGPLVEDLEQWTLHDPTNAAFASPGSTTPNAPAAMRAAFTKTVDSLTKQLGNDPADWTWGRLHQRKIPSLTGAAALGYGPFPAGGDPWTPNAADDGMVSDFGPSWRMTVTWTGPGQSTAKAIYPGGQSEDPASPWYQNLIPLWWDGRYLPLRTAAEQSRDGTSSGDVRWTLRPER